MSILEFMSFDPSWFITIPGLLITGGVVLLLIALIVFVATSKKDKGASVDPTVDGSIPLVNGPDDLTNQAINATTPADMSNMINQQPAASMMEVNNVGQSVDFNGMTNVAPSTMPSNVDFVGANPEVPSTPVFPQTDVTPVQEVPVNIAPVAAGINVGGTVGTDNTNGATSTPQISFDAPQDVPISLNVPQGSNQVIDFGNVPQAPVQTPISDVSSRPIYGGANPLENTATIPTVSNHAAYNGEVIVPNSVVEEVKVVDQVPQVPMQASQPVAVAENSADMIPTVNVAPEPAVITTPTPSSVPSPTPAPAANSNDGIESLF